MYRALLLLVVGLPLVALGATYEQVQQDMLDDPANPQKSFNFVKAAISEGDLLGAVGALERILRVDPTLANIQLELGVLYLRLDAPAAAARYIDASLKSPDVPVWVRNRAKTLLAHANQANERHQFSFGIVGNTTHDSNANAAPTDPEVRVGGGFGVLDEDDTGRSDLSWGVLTSGQYTYAFNSEVGNQLELSFGSFNKRYDRSSELDVDSLRMELGPRFFFGPVFNPSVSLKPYILASRLDLDGDKYLESTGLGFNVRRLFSPALRGDFYLEYRDQDYSNTTLRRAEDRSGDQFGLRGQLSYILDPKRVLSFETALGQRDAEVDWETRDFYAMQLTYSQAFRPLGDTGRPWRWILGLRAERLDYDAGDPAIDPGTARRDDRLRASMSASLPLSKHLNLLVTTSYTDVDSNLPNFEYDNWGGSLGIRLGF